MRSFVLILILVLFAANSIVSAAWAKPCAMMDMTMVKQSMSDMKCHDQMEQKQKPQQHCEGICLCLHVSVSQMPLLQDQIVLSVIPYTNTAWSFSNDHVNGLSSAPPLRPPKTFS